MSSRPLDLEIQNSTWSRATLEKACVFIKDGTHGTHIRVDSGIPLLSAKNISTAGTVDWDSEDSLISEEDYSKIHAKYELEQDDLLLTVVGTLGRRALVSKGKKYTIQRSVAALRLNHAIALPKFLFQFVASDYFQRQLILRSNATAQAGVYLGELARIQIPVPSVQEQQKIASILTAVDEVIESTTAQINKLKDLKTGMMQELLTKGIGHTEFKDSPVGRIPKVWEVRTLGSLAEFKSGYAFKSEELSEAGLEVVRISNLHKPDFHYWHYNGKIKDSWLVNSGDILFSWAGVANSINVHRYQGKTALLNQHIFNFAFESDETKEWVYQNLKSALPELKRNIEGGAGQLHLTKGFIQGIGIPFPPYQERLIIREMLENIDLKINKISHKLTQFLLLKKSLMQDLLTGKNRVSVS